MQYFSMTLREEKCNGQLDYIFKTSRSLITHYGPRVRGPKRAVLAVLAVNPGKADFGHANYNLEELNFATII